MLFNKSNNGQAELKSLMGFLHASNTFANIETDILLEHEAMTELIGKPVMDKAQTHYDSAAYNTGGDVKLLDDLVHYIQLPVAYYATHNYASHSDVTHGDDGRKVVIDSANEKMAWEWMIARDDEATLNKAHKTTDRLIAFLEANATNIAEWKDSAAQKLARSLFINTARQFDDIFPIDNSRRFFLKILPFIRESERKYLLPVLGKTRFDDIKAALLTGNFTDYEDMLLLIRVPLVYYSLSLAVKRLSINMLPNGIFQDYISDRLTMKAKQPAPTDVRREIGQSFLADALLELENLQKELSKLDAEAAAIDYVPVDPIAHIDPEAQIFRI
jgi:hypothetical protein